MKITYELNDLKALINEQLKPTGKRVKSIKERIEKKSYYRDEDDFGYGGREKVTYDIFVGIEVETERIPEVGE
jgi:hypothetical protein